MVFWGMASVPHCVRQVLPLGSFADMDEPIMRYFEDLVVGEKVWGVEEVADLDEMIGYARRYDPWPFHVDEAAARDAGFDGLIASSGYAIGLWYSSGCRGIWNRPGSPVALIGGIDMKAKFGHPLKAGDRVRTSSVIDSKRLSSKPGRGVVEATSELVSHNGDVIITAQMVYLIRTGP